MKILLIFPPEWTDSSPSLGISMIASVLKKAGHEVILRDYNIEIANELPDEYRKYWVPTNMGSWEEEPYTTELAPVINPLLKEKLIKDIETYEINAVGFSVYCSNYQAFKFLIKTTKKKFPNILTFAGGPSVDPFQIESLLKEQILDAAVIGEGEEAVIDLFDAFTKKDYSSAIKGVWRNFKGDIIKGSPRSLMSFDDLGIPDFSDLNLDLYREKSLPFMISRGCVAKCNFCSETFFWNKYRTLQAKNVFNWLSHLHEKFQITRFFSHDSLMNGSHQVLEQLVDQIIEAELEINWSGYCRVDKRLTDELITKMANAGCVGINFGIESASQRVLDFMDKGMQISEAYRVLPMCKKVGIHVSIGIIVGYPTEEDEDFEKTLRFINDMQDSIDVFCTGNTLAIPSNTPIFHDREKFNIELSSKWNEWVTKDGKNTWEIRKKRIKRLRNYLDSIGANWV